MLALGGCLVTEPIQFDDTQLAAYLRNPRPYSFSRVPPVRDAACTGNDNGPFMAFSVDIVDANIDEVLSVRLYVNGRWVEGAKVPVTGQAERGTVTLCATRGDVGEACNHVQMVVTSEFEERGANIYATVDPNDYAEVEWWVLSPALTSPFASQLECTRWADAGVL